MRCSRLKKMVSCFSALGLVALASACGDNLAEPPSEQESTLSDDDLSDLDALMDAQEPSLSVAAVIGRVCGEFGIAHYSSWLDGSEITEEQYDCHWLFFDPRISREEPFTSSSQCAGELDVGRGGPVEATLTIVDPDTGEYGVDSAYPTVLDQEAMAIELVASVPECGLEVDYELELFGGIGPKTFVIGAFESEDDIPFDSIVDAPFSSSGTLVLPEPGSYHLYAYYSDEPIVDGICRVEVSQDITLTACDHDDDGKDDDKPYCPEHDDDHAPH